VRAWIGAAFIGLAATQAVAQSTPRQDELIANYFAIWDQDSHVTPDNVARLYASRLVYYGHPMSREALLRDKLAFIRRWPDRHYGIEPGSAAKRCNPDESRCAITANLLWRTRGPGGARAGRSRVTLQLAREDGQLKIVREGAVTLSQ
jgi:hypothetical protein